jgi:hypothetical protein
VTPRYRASMAKGVLENVEAEAPELVAALPPDIVAEIHQASRADWIPAAALEAVYAAVITADGEARLQAINRVYTRKAMDIPVFGPLVKGATNLFGGGPRGLLRVLPNSWDLVTRDCGTVLVEFPSATEAIVRYSELPAELRTHGFSVSSESSPLGIFDALGVRGEVLGDASKLAAEGLLELRVTWTPK